MSDAFSLLCWTAAMLAALPAAMTAINLPLFHRPPRHRGEPLAVSVIVPARDEEAEIGGSLAALRASAGVELEVIVVDDHSRDRTAAIVSAVAAQDARVRLERAPPLPPGWSGKQHACHVGASRARHPILLFLDCDVRVAAGAVADMAGYLHRRDLPLLSGFPRERTLSWGERLLIPLIHVLLLGYLPMPGLRLTRLPGFGAGCGQIMLCDAAAYRAVGGHAAIRASWHDGLQLPRAFRRRGLRTDILDASRLAECRMYAGLRATWRGLSKNAGEGMATPVALPVWTVLLGGGLAAPFLLLPAALLAAPQSEATGALLAATSTLLLARLVVAWRCRQDVWAVPLLPAGIVALLALQWRALLAPRRALAGGWRGRTQLSR